MQGYGWTDACNLWDSILKGMRTHQVFWDQVSVPESPPGIGMCAVGMWASGGKDGVEQGVYCMLGEPTSPGFLALWR